MSKSSARSNPPYWENVERDDDACCMVIIGDNVLIDAGCTIGYNKIQKPREKYKLVVNIGDNTKIRSGAIIYAGVTIGKNCSIGHNVVIRENTVIGDGTSIGACSVIEGNMTIGSNCSIWTHAHITAYSSIGNNVFIAPHFVSLNDPVMGYQRWNLHESRTIKGPTIEDNVRISANVTIQPGLTIGREAVVGTGSVVTKNIPSGDVVYGIPAKSHGVVPEENYWETNNNDHDNP